VLLGVTGALALACFVKVCSVVFLGAPRTQAASQAHECGWPMRGAMLVLAGGCVAIGLAPIFFWPALARAIGAWCPAWSNPEEPAPLCTLGWVHVALAVAAAVAAWWLWRKVSRRGLNRALTWDCGYALPTARMQYTAGSFAGIITEWFAWILQPERHEHRAEDVFPAQASFEEHTPETVLERVVYPVSRVVMQISATARRLQHGRLQAYLLYLVIGLAVLAGLVLIGGGQ
jgi:hydrogenase-4 component B